MRPILLNGHTRSLTKIKYNREGDLLFSVSKDHTPTVWYSHNGERLGTYDGHNGTCWDIDVNGTTTRVLTGSGDNTCRLWEATTGKQLHVFETKSAVRSVAFAFGDKEAIFVTDATMGNKSTIHFIKIAENPEEQQPPYKTIITDGSKFTIARWGYLNKTIVAGHDDGTITIFDAETGEIIRKAKDHTSTIQDLQFSNDLSYFITASKDTNSFIYDYETLKILKKYPTERPVNSAAISPLKEHIILGGGQDAMSVTTTSVTAGKFEVRFFHKIFQEEIGRVKGHFGPINTLAFHPSGKSFASGGEDGYIRIHHLDPDYFTFKYDEEE
jgi:FOG: WD40 repeat